MSLGLPEYREKVLSTSLQVDSIRMVTTTTSTTALISCSSFIVHSPLLSLKSDTNTLALRPVVLYHTACSSPSPAKFASFSPQEAVLLPMPTFPAVAVPLWAFRSRWAHKGISGLEVLYWLLAPAYSTHAQRSCPVRLSFHLAGWGSSTKTKAIASVSIGNK